MDEYKQKEFREYLVKQEVVLSMVKCNYSYGRISFIVVAKRS